MSLLIAKVMSGEVGRDLSDYRTDGTGEVAPLHYCCCPPTIQLLLGLHSYTFSSTSSCGSRCLSRWKSRMPLYHAAGILPSHGTKTHREVCVQPRRQNTLRHTVVRCFSHCYCQDALRRQNLNKTKNKPQWAKRLGALLGYVSQRS